MSKFKQIARSRFCKVCGNIFGGRFKDGKTCFNCKDYNQKSVHIRYLIKKYDKFTFTKEEREFCINYIEKEYKDYRQIELIQQIKLYL